MALDNELIRLAEPALAHRREGAAQPADREHEPRRRRHAVERDHQARRAGDAARRHDPLPLLRQRRTEFRRLAREGRDARSGRRRERLRRQGTLRRPHHHLSADDEFVRGRGQHPDRQRRDVRRHERRSLLPRHRRGTLRGAQQRRHRRHRRRRRSRLRVHDRRPSGRVGRNRAQLCRRHERRRRLRLGPERRIRGSAATPKWWSSKRLQKTRTSSN